MIFLPLSQQHRACSDIMGILPSKTAVLTGEVHHKKRRQLWRTKKFFFATGQTIVSDINRQDCPTERIVCVVFDEAHKASGEHSYCRVMKELVHPKLRVLGLSATPGKNIDDVLKVYKELFSPCAPAPLCFVGIVLVCRCVCMYVCVCVYVYVCVCCVCCMCCMCVCMRVYVCVCVCICLCVYHHLTHCVCNSCIPSFNSLSFSSRSGHPQSQDQEIRIALRS